MSHHTTLFAEGDGSILILVKYNGLSLHTTQVAAHQAGAYPGFSNMKRLGVLLSPGWDANPSPGYPQH